MRTCIRLFTVCIQSLEICFKEKKGINLIRRETTGWKKKRALSVQTQVQMLKLATLFSLRQCKSILHYRGSGKRH